MRIVPADRAMRLVFWWSLFGFMASMLEAVLPIFFSIPFMIVAVIGWLILLLVLLFCGIRHRRRETLMPIGALAIGAAVLCFTPIGEVGIYGRAMYESVRYHSFVAKVRRNEQPKCPESAYCQVEGTRMAFVWDGIIDNWVGLCMDPSNTLLDVEANRDIFGGDLTDARRLWGDWYSCGFT